MVSVAADAATEHANTRERMQATEVFDETVRGMISYLPFQRLRIAEGGGWEIERLPREFRAVTAIVLVYARMRCPALPTGSDRSGRQRHCRRRLRLLRHTRCLNSAATGWHCRHRADWCRTNK